MNRFAPEIYPDPPKHPNSDMWGRISPEVIVREHIYQTPGAETHFIRTVLGKRLAVEVMGDPDGYPIILQPGTPPVMAERVPAGAKVISVYRPGYAFSCFDPHYTVSASTYTTAIIAKYIGFSEYGSVGRSGGAGHALAPGAIGKEINLLPESCAVVVPIAPYKLMGESFFTGLGSLNTKISSSLFSNYPDGYRPYRGRRPILTTIPWDAEGYVKDTLGQLRTDTLRLLEDYFDETFAEKSNDTGARRRFAAAHAAALRFGNLGRYQDLKNQKDWGFNLDISVPTLVWAAESDQFCPTPHARKIAECIGSAATLHIEPNTTHHDGVDATLIGIQWCLDHAGR